MALVQKELKNAYIGEYVAPIDTPGIYHNATLGLISLSSDGSNWLTIADKNLGATQVYNGGDALSVSNMGNLYQWGNNYGFSSIGTLTLTQGTVDASSYGPGNYYSSNIFRGSGSYWDNSNNGNLWGGTTGTNAAMQGPCESGFHVPTADERVALTNLGITLGAWTASSGTNIKNYLKIPYAGRRIANGTKQLQGSTAYLWSCIHYYNSAASAYYAYDMAFGDSFVYSKDTNYGAKIISLSIRPFKNEAVQPDESRTKLN